MKRLKNKIAVITGASSGIGAAITELFASEGADVAVNYLTSKEKAEKVISNIRSEGRQAEIFQADMSEKNEINQLIQKIIEKFGKIDILVNNAGADILTGEGSTADTHTKLEKLIETDLKGTINACWSIAETMEKQGHGVIVNMGWD